MKHEGSKLVNEFEKAKYTGDVTLKLKDGGLSAFNIPLNKMNVVSFKEALQKMDDKIMESLKIPPELLKD